MKVYCVRQKSTDLFIPRLETGKRRGGSHLEPSNEREPRIFHSAHAARSFLGCWLQGIFEKDYQVSSDGEEDWGNKVIPQPHRNKDDMEIVEFDCVTSPVYVIMGNDYPSAVFKNEEAAEAYCRMKREEPASKSEYGTRIFWRSYEFKLQ